MRTFEKGTYVTVREHLPAYKIYSETERQAKAEEQMRKLASMPTSISRFSLPKGGDTGTKMFVPLPGLLSYTGVRR